MCMFSLLICLKQHHALFCEVVFMVLALTMLDFLGGFFFLPNRICRNVKFEMGFPQILVLLLG
jgi:hypothetical protein